MTNQSMLSIVHSLPQAAILFNHLTNITSMTNIPSTNDTKKNAFGNSVGSKHCAF